MKIIKQIIPLLLTIPWHIACFDYCDRKTRERTNNPPRDPLKEKEIESEISNKMESKRAQGKEACVICLDDEDETIEPLYKSICCAQYFHASCLVRWRREQLAQKRTPKCPCCQQDYPKLAI